jgi:DNA-binding NtrC family response regulator
MARILVIDDDQEIRSLLRDILEPEGFEVADAPNGRVGIKLFKQHSYDLVITDMLMPEQEGIETIAELQEKSPSIRIVAMSGGGSRGNLNVLVDAKRFGAAVTISKPFGPTEILDAVHAALRFPLARPAPAGS